jgi:cytochrome o ubiquinol oxidase operon protein cyoD
MSEQTKSVKVLVSLHQPEQTNLKNYIIGFIASLALTLIAYFITQYHTSGGRTLLFWALSVLALSQFLIQLFFFLHVGREFPPRYKLMITSFMILVVLILVGGSLWIMHSLDGRVMPTTQQMIKYMNSQDNL